jgi:hypothetical protein
MRPFSTPPSRRAPGACAGAAIARGMSEAQAGPMTLRGAIGVPASESPLCGWGGKLAAGARRTNGVNPHHPRQHVPTSASTAPPHSARRDFIRIASGLGAALGTAAALGWPARSAVAAPAPAAADAANAPFDLAALAMPYRQDDPAWGDDVMWDRKLVVRAATQLNRMGKAAANDLLRQFPDGNTIANEGCQLTCMAMALRMLAPAGGAAWTPRTLNRDAQAALYYTKSGLSMTALGADLVSEVSSGAVQLAVKEEYLPAVAPWKRMFADTAPLVRAYRGLSPQARADFVVMLKIGTYDDTVASHYVLLNPNAQESPDLRDAAILDPAMPAGRTGPWRLSDSAAWICTDPDIADAWQADGIQPTQVAGAWVFSRWNAAQGRSRIAPLVAAWAHELAAG